MDVLKQKNQSFIKCKNQYPWILIYTRLSFAPCKTHRINIDKIWPLTSLKASSVVSSPVSHWVRDSFVSCETYWSAVAYRRSRRCWPCPSRRQSAARSCRTRPFSRVWPYRWPRSWYRRPRRSDCRSRVRCGVGRPCGYWPCERPESAVPRYLGVKFYNPAMREREILGCFTTPTFVWIFSREEIIHGDGNDFLLVL